MAATMTQPTQSPPKPPQGATSQGPPAGAAAQAPGPQGGQEQRPASVPAKQLRVGKFRLRSGDHLDDQLAWLPRQRVLAYAEEAGIAGAEGMAEPALRTAVRASRVAERRWRAGNVVASPKPLASRWPEKWERVGDEVPESPGLPTLPRSNDEIEESYTEQAMQREIDADVSDDLHRLDVGRLRELAYQEGIDLGAADGKAAILATVRRVRRAVAEDR